MKEWFSFFKNIVGMLSGLIGVVFVFVPLSDATASNIGSRILIMVALVVLSLIASVIWTIYDRNKTSKKIYSKGNTSIIFEYEKIENVFEAAQNDDVTTTFVIPVNRNLDVSADINNIRKGTIHHWALEKMNISVDKDFINGLKIKSDGFDENGKKGDWFLITLNDLDGSCKNVNFLFIEVFNMIKKNGSWVNDTISVEEYLVMIQKVITAVSESVDYESKVYLPLIGAGAGNVGKPTDIMQLMASMLRFNRKRIRHEVHVIIDKKYKEDTPIYQLSEF